MRLNKPEIIKKIDFRLKHVSDYLLDLNRKRSYITVIFGSIILILIGLSGCLTICSIGQSNCGNSCYDPNIQTCCNGEIFQGYLATSICEKTCYNKFTQTCCNGNVTEKGICCGNVSYKDLTQSCCNNQVYEGHWSECGDTCYDDKNSNQICCNGNLYPNRGDWERCGNACYDQKTQSCCGSKIIEGLNRCCKMRKDTDWKICSAGQKCCPDYQKGSVCYNPSIYKCKVVSDYEK